MSQITATSRALLRPPLVAVLIALLAMVTHAYYLSQSPGAGVDEWIYVQTANVYALDIVEGKPTQVLTESLNTEHPAFSKLLFAAADLVDWRVNGVNSLPRDLDASIAPDSPASQSFIRLRDDDRLMSSGLAILATGILAFVNPVAGIFLALSSPMVSYSSVAYLESAGILFSTLAVVLFMRSTSRRMLLLSGICVGLAMASKYYYAIVLVPLLLTLVLKRPGITRLWSSAQLVLAAAVAFLLADAPFVFQGFARTMGLVSQRGIEYASGWDVMSAEMSTHWYSELSMLGLGFSSWYRGGVSPFLFTIDPIIAVLGAAGAVLLLRRLAIPGVWLVTAGAVLLLYPVKYPQYTLLAVVPLCWCAGEAVTALVAWAARRRAPVSTRIQHLTDRPSIGAA